MLGILYQVNFTIYRNAIAIDFCLNLRRIVLVQRGGNKPPLTLNDSLTLR
ncbi:hypothetical protein [Nostoc sp.]